MLQFVTGRAGSGKTEYLRREIAVRSKDCEGCIMLVPEQYSFETEKAVMHLAGPQKANCIQVLSFTRLADLIFRTEGGISGRRLSDGGRRMMMNMAIAACQDHLMLYAAAGKSGRLTDTMLNAVNEMKMCGITGADLRDAAHRQPGEGLSGKLREIALIGETYDAMVAASYLDARDDLTRLAEKLETSNFFTGRYVAVDSFEGFTVQELRVLAQILRRADTLQVALCTDNLPDESEMGLFALTNRTKAQLSRIAQEQSVKRKPDVHLHTPVRFTNENLVLLERNLFDSPEPETSQSHEGITLFCGADAYEEAEYAAAAIRDLVMEQGYRYRDFSVICRNPQRYSDCLSVSLSKRDIPCFISMPERVDTQPVMRFVLCAFAVVQRGFRTEDILEMLKTGISGFLPEEISDLENYAFLWRIDGKAWLSGWDRHPGGFGRELTQVDAESLNQLNLLRSRVVSPLKRFAEISKEAGGRQISQGVYQLLCEFQMEETLPEYCRFLTEQGEPELADKQLRVWELLMEILDQMAVILGEGTMPRERYFGLLKEVVRGEDISEIPMRLDSVLFGTPEQVRQASPKVVFLLGAAQGEFPMLPKASGAFSDAERKKLISQFSLPLTDPLEQKTLEERYLAYSVTCAPSQMLYLCYPATIDGQEAAAGELVNSVLGVFPDLQPVKGLPASYYANAAEAAFRRMASLYRVNTPEAAALRSLFQQAPAYADRLQALARAATLSPEQIADKTLPREFYGDTLALSPSQIEAFYSCRFRHFCQYALRARERRTAEVDAMQYGTVMHYIFEKIFTAGRFQIPDLAPLAMLEEIRRLIRAYADESMGGFAKLSAREQYRMERMAQSAAMLLQHMAEELAQSKFQPAHMEMQLGYGKDFPALKIYTPEKMEVYVGGTIDRVDVLESEKGRYVRVVDYKTGKKEFQLADVLYGLNMQMLLYLAALVEHGEVLPAGVLYTPLATPSVTADYGTEPDEIKKEADKNLKMNGLVLSDADIVSAMEAQGKGRYIPVSLTKDGAVAKSASALQPEELQEVLAYSKRLVATMADKLIFGDVAAQPMMHQVNSCQYCPYGAVCGREYDENDVDMEKQAKDDILRQIQEGEKAQWQ